jgi:hypothetical protein
MKDYSKGMEVAQDAGVRIFKLFKEKVCADVNLKRVIAVRESSMRVIDDMIAEDIVFQLTTFLSACDPKVHSEQTYMYFGHTPVNNFWNILKLAVKLFPGLPKSWQRKIDVEWYEHKGEYETVHITRHLCPHYRFDGDMRQHINFLTGENDSSEDI